MRHYSNRQAPKQHNQNNIPQNNNRMPAPVKDLPPLEPPQNNTSSFTDSSDEELIFPPSSDFELGLTEPYNIYNMSQYNELNAQGGAVSQSGGYTKQLSEDVKNNFCSSEDCSLCADGCPMLNGIPQRFNSTSGNIGTVSLPHMNSLAPTLSMSTYLNPYKGKYICIDLWTSDARRIEKCGTLVDIGTDFLVIRKCCTGEMTMVDLNSIRYVSLYSR